MNKTGFMPLAFLVYVQGHMFLAPLDHSCCMALLLGGGILTTLPPSRPFGQGLFEARWSLTTTFHIVCLYFLLCSFAAEESRPRNQHDKLMELFTLAQQLEDAEALRGYVGAIAGADNEDAEVRAARIMASLNDADTLQLHKLAVKVVKNAGHERRQR